MRGGLARGHSAGMDREHLSVLAHTRHPVAAPVDDDTVRRLLAHTLRRGDERLLDLGCGGAEWLLRALAEHPGVRAEGVDVSAAALARAEEAATARGVRDRLVLHRRDCAEFAESADTSSPGRSHGFDVVLGVGACHAFGGLLPTLAAARGRLAPGGLVLVGDGFWEREPGSEAVAMLGELSDLESTVDAVVADGWTPLYGHISSRRELDDYEWCWSGSLASWALNRRVAAAGSDEFGAHGSGAGTGAPDNEADTAQALSAAAEHRTGWLRHYRDALGFLCLVLARTDTGD